MLILVALLLVLALIDMLIRWDLGPGNAVSLGLMSGLFYIQLRWIRQGTIDHEDAPQLLWSLVAKPFIYILVLSLGWYWLFTKVDSQLVLVLLLFVMIGVEIAVVQMLRGSVAGEE